MREWITYCVLSYLKPTKGAHLGGGIDLGKVNPFLANSYFKIDLLYSYYIIVAMKVPAALVGNDHGGCLNS